MSFNDATLCPRALALARTAALVNDYRAYLSLIYFFLLLLALAKADQAARAHDEEGNADSKPLDLEGKPHEVTDAGNLIQKCEGGSVTATAASCTGTTVLSLQYDADNRLAQASGNGVSETYGYDDQGRRIRKTSNGVTTFYLYNGPDIIAEYQGDWSKPKAFTTHGPATDDPVVRYTRNASGGYDKRYYHQDTQNSSVAVTDANGALIGAQLFDAWGNSLPGAQFGTIERHGYAGREPDATGLIYYRARYYDPATARFTQRDPIGLRGGINQYAYVGNDPVNYGDPRGLNKQPPGAVQCTYPVSVSPPEGQVVTQVTVVMLDEDTRKPISDLSQSLADPRRDALQGSLFVDDLFGPGLFKAGAALLGATKLLGREAATGVVDVARGVKPYEVGPFNELKPRSTGDMLDIHHAGQANPMEQVIPGYSRSSAPSIAVPRNEHQMIPTQRGPYEGTARDQLAKDILDLRNYTNAPNSSLQDLT